ncbi:2Fe-2S iron-sulfur cluster-binding protein [Sneathiella litorea]|uniref:2Fe-2S iron-sulfur cluster binding domain-containing protein n=1 Tax=Sneathiella litorea TaxID=2606216 RepID=A0A6L8W5I6_9PROT|nr:2Fe-2S iron-sulfur cluster-binding protein [Sneathiella litorea]MZR29640.1 2Fe-2S iron-sulfur cluster binding domain-containing protein [Sneathiella litorea]
MQELKAVTKGDTFRVSIANSDLSFETNSKDTILGSLLRSGIGAPYECNSGGCGSCKFKLIEGSIREDYETCPGLRPSDRRKNKHLACTCRAESDCVIELQLDSSYAPKIRPSIKALKFISRTPLTHDLWTFRFQSEEPANFLSGQYSRMHIPGVSGARSYSMSNTPNDAGIWEFQIKRVPSGKATAVLFESNLAELSITIDAPYSVAHLDANSPRSIICIAGGSGLAPMVSILRGVAELQDRADQPILYYGARSQRDVVDPDYFLSVPGFDPGTQYIPIVSEPSADCVGPSGFVHEYLAQALPDDCSQMDFYIAGPPPMVEAVRRHLILDRKIPVDQLHYDRFF